MSDLLHTSVCERDFWDVVCETSGHGAQEMTASLHCCHHPAPCYALCVCVCVCVCVCARSRSSLAVLKHFQCNYGLKSIPSTSLQTGKSLSLFLFYSVLFYLLSLSCSVDSTRPLNKLWCWQPMKVLLFFIKPSSGCYKTLCLTQAWN